MAAIVALALLLAGCPGIYKEGAFSQPQILPTVPADAPEAEPRAGSSNPAQNTVPGAAVDPLDTARLKPDVSGMGRDVALVEIARRHEAWLQALLEEVKERAARGELSKTDVAQVEARLHALAARRIALEGNLAVSRARYRAIVGQPAPGAPQ